ncbi:MAG: hypothetical protein AAGC78_21110 [Cellvibrio sp.]|uniref:peptidoglycan-binding domain-containing protein n=1 Tax=Cellvibrio sp. TaxID=1965322 RepID=UPI0031B08492
MGIATSVGSSGVNNKEDVLFVQSALNAYAKKHASNTFLLKVDGICGDDTTQAIFNFQKNHVGIAHPNARIDPRGRTLNYLIRHQPHTNAPRYQTHS